MKKNGLLLIGCFLVVCNVLAQKIKFEGLKRCKSSYLLQCASCTDLQTFDTLYVKTVVQRVKNTRLFSEVHYKVEATEKDTVVVITCKEVQAILPIVELGATQGNQWFRIGVADENGLGRGIQTIFYYQYNDLHSFYLRQRIPFVLGKWNLGYALKRWSFIEPFTMNRQLQYYNYHNTSAEISASYAFVPLRHQVLVGVGYFDEHFVHTEPDKYMDSPRFFKQHGVSLKGMHELTYLDHHSFYVGGWANSLHLSIAHNGAGKMPLGMVFNDTRYFKTLPAKGNLALRGRVGISSNVNLFSAPFVLDNYLNIRSVGNRIDRGTASVVVNMEYRQTLWETKSFGMQGVLFSDAGAWRKSGGKVGDMLHTDNTKMFAGVGTRLIYKKAFDVILRLDYGWAIRGVGNGFVFGLGQYF